MASRQLSWLLPLLALVLFIPYSSGWDLAASGHYFHDGHFNPTPFNQFLYDRGELPGLAVGGLAVLVWLMTFVSTRWQRWRLPAGAIALAFVIGPGLLVNGAFKEFWGRPRPVQIKEFGGPADYLPFYQPEFSNRGYGYKSFPSGHASMGFFLFVVALVAKRERKPLLFWLSMIVAIALGVMLAETRIAQGGHFLSDTIVSAVLMWWIALLACRVTYGRALSSSPYAT